MNHPTTTTTTTDSPPTTPTTEQTETSTTPTPEQTGTSTTTTTTSTTTIVTTTTTITTTTTNLTRSPSNIFLLSKPPSSRSLTAYNKNHQPKSKSSPKLLKNNSPLSPPASLPKQTPILIRSRKPSSNYSSNLVSSPTFSSPPPTATTHQPQFDSPPLSPTPLFLKSSSSSLSSPSPSSCRHPLFNPRRLSQISSPPIPVKESSNGRLSEDRLVEGQRRLNQYLLIRSIGRGSYGSVELAKDTTSDQLYAVKEYSKKQMRRRAQKSALNRHHLNSSQRLLGSPSSSDGIQLVKAEVAIMKKLSHVNIVCLHEVIDTQTDSLFFVLELCPFGPVMLIKNGTTVEPLSEQSARNIFRQLFLGIEYLHFHEIIHRDIKPDNILYYEDPKAVFDPLCKIVDFGVSESFSKPGDDTVHKSAGSPAFLAPEMCKGSSEGVHGRMTDIWAMGVTLYALVYGRLPFEGDNPIGLYEKILTERPQFPAKKGSDLLVELLNSMLNKSPDCRIEMGQFRVSRWVTEDGKDPLDEQCGSLLPMEPPTDREIAEAFKSFKTVATIFRAIGKFRARKSASPSTSNSQPDDETSNNLVRTMSIRSDGYTSATYLNQILDSPKSSLTNSPRPAIRALTSPSCISKLTRPDSRELDSTRQIPPAISTTIASNTSTSTSTSNDSSSTKAIGFDQLDQFQNHQLLVEDLDHLDLTATHQLDLDQAIDSLAVLDF